MARITPSENRVGPELEDDTPYKATIERIEWGVSSPEYGAEKRLQIDLLPDGCQPHETVRDWIGLRLGKQQNGTVSKLRQLLNAIAGRPSTAEIAWFDDETCEISWDGEKADDQLAVGREVVFEGINGTKNDGSAKFTIIRYRKVAAPAAANGAKSKPKPATAPVPVGAAVDVDPDSIPF